MNRTLKQTGIGSIVINDRTSVDIRGKREWRMRLFAEGVM